MPEQKTVTFTINERKLTVPAGTLVIEAARRTGIEVPAFCYYPGLSLQAACRMCLVEVEKAPKLQTACTLVAADGMVVRTDTPQVHKARKDMLEFLLTNHPLDCPVCDKGGECELQDMTFRYGLDKSRFVEEKLHSPEQAWSPVVYYDAPRCILCFRCVRVCDEGMDVKALGVGQRGVLSVIIPNREDHLECEECGMCIDVCPVGALTSGAYRYKTRPWEMKYVPTVCAHCSNGCKTTLGVRNNEIQRANNRDLSGINKDFLCVKGRYGFDFVHHPDRLKQPLVRRNGTLQIASWEDALAEVAARLKTVRDAHGPDAIGFIGSNRTTNEENYLLGRLARGLVGTNNVDHHRTADYGALVQALGESAGAAQAGMEQLGAAKAILLIGNDPTNQNPLVAWQIRTAIRQNGARLYVVNTEEIKLKRKAAQFVRVASGAEALIAQWLATGEGDLELDTSVEMMQLRGAMEKERDAVIVFGAELRGAAIEHVVKFGASLPGQTRYIALGDYANSRGASDMGLLPDRLPGYVWTSDAAARDAFGKLWGASLPEKTGLDSRQMLAAAARGALKALYVVGANPFRTFGAGGRPAGLDWVVVQEMFLTETSRDADIVLPAACAYEKDGTVTNTAGEVQLLRRGLETMGTRTDFDILRILSHQLSKAGVGRAIPLRTPEAALDEIRRSVRGYGVSLPGLLAGGAERTAPLAPANGHKLIDVPAESIFSPRDTLFTSGTLGRYCTMIHSVPEAKSES
ncbi:MAG: NADH-quinone oxidoreductase subunit NuoG [Acidobacteria bacterium]|nr:NADH-quinone oxidoreductase subunit NuoG [Acidobacteriota bacterium]MBI3662483.1 NADH-quinone oxidoreductase subunit NuoG [Acidobacteriota bacterium]